jgi:bifunctional non-homologous end joining protein LigD
MVEVSNANRVVFPEVNRTKGDVVAYYERIAPRALPHVVDRPLSIRRYPKGLAGPGFFQKNVPKHYPDSIRRFSVPRSEAATKKHPQVEGKDQNVTVYPLVSTAEHLAYLANQGALELHVPTFRASDSFRPDRLVIDLDPPPGSFDLVRRAAHLAREALAEAGLSVVPVVTGSKGYHLVAAIQPSLEVDVIALTVQRLAALIVAKHPDVFTSVFRIALRQGKVFVDWMRLGLASVVAPYSLRATARATVAAPIAWDEIETTDPNSFTIGDVDRLLDRADSLAELAAVPADPAPFAAAVEAAFEKSGLVLEQFDRFRS